MQPGFRISRVFSPLRRQLVATSIISPAKPATRNTRSRVLTQVGAGVVGEGKVRVKSCFR